MAIPSMRCLHPEKTSTQKPMLSLFPLSIPQSMLTLDDLKRIAEYEAVDFVMSGMVVGLGTGSTAKHAVARIAELINTGKLENIVGIPTSKATEEQALSLGIPLSDLDHHSVVDLVIDGSDEVDPDCNLIKGRGSSLYREKRVESECRKFIVIVDTTKVVKNLGESGHAMPVEVLQFGLNVTLGKLQSLFKSFVCVAKLLTGGNGEPFLTDNMNYIVDLYFKKGIGDVKATSDAIKRQIGVVEHGMFLDMATTVIVAGSLRVSVKHNPRAILHPFSEV